MSKKNNKGTKRRVHEHDLKKEKEELAKRQKVLEKQQLSQSSTGGGVQKAPRKKGFRIRKGVHIKGIKVVDSESKKKVRQLLKAEAAMKMDVDGAKPKTKKKSGGLKGVKGFKAGSLKKKRESKRPSTAAPASMQE